MGEYDKKRTKAAATAGPSADDRFGPGPLGSNIQSRILKVDVVNDRTRVTIARGKMHGVAVGMEGYVKGAGGPLSELQIEEVRDAMCFAFVEVTPDQLAGHLNVVINPSTMPRAFITKDVSTRVINVSVEGGRTRIIIARGSSHGVTAGMRGQLRSGDGREGEDFTIEGTTAMQSFAYVASTVDHVNAHQNVVLHPNASPRAPIQRRANGTAVNVDVQATAQAGVAGANSRLPHFDAIQRSFGKHDISNVQARVGGAATSAAASLGAQAYATGNKVAFASAPDLHTAAHEAAHTIQQQRGAVGFQGLGAADDEHERHADAVADAVVAGQSAEPLLDSVTGSGSEATVQRKPTFGVGERKGVFEIGGEDLTRPTEGFGSAQAVSITKLDVAPRTQERKSESFSVHVRNETGDTLELEAWVSDPLRPGSPSGSNVFKVTRVAPQRLNAGGSGTVVIRFRPPSTGTFRGDLDLGIRGGAHLMSVALLGTGLEDPAKRKHTEAPAKEKDVGPVVEVDTVDSPDLSDQRELTYADLLSHWTKLLEAGLRNLDLALDNFETVATAPSSKETIEESSASVIFGEIMKHYADHLVSYMLKPLPFGSEIGEFLAVGSWSEAVRTEKRRTRKAGEDHILMRYIVGCRELLGQKQAALASKATPLIRKRITEHESRDEANQALDRNDLMIVNERWTRHIISGHGTVSGCFSDIVCTWTNHTKVPGSKQTAHVRIRYDREWNLMFAKLEAPRGERLAEELTRDGRAVNLQTLPVRRVIEWKPHLAKNVAHPHLHQASIFFSREIDETGTWQETRWSEFAADLKPEFEEKAASLVLPVVTELKGTSSK